MGNLTQKDVLENENYGSNNMVEIMMRLLPMALCVVALVIMLKDSQTNDFGSLSYSDLGTFRYLVHANGICAGYSLVSAIITALPHPTTLPRAWTFFILDQVLTYITLSVGAASTEVVYLGYKGDVAVTWSETCDSYEGFCRKATTSVSITFIVSLCYVGISLLSSYKLFTKYDAPIESPHYNNNNKGGIEIANY